MAHPALELVRGTACVLVSVAALVVLLSTPVAAGDAGTDGARPASGAFGTRPPRLDRAAVVRAANGFGIDGAPERTPDGWEAEDDVRSLYLSRSPSAWYVHFTDGSLLLGPAGDRDAICAAPDAPYGCTVPEVTFVADAGAPPPDASTTRRVALDVLERTGLLTGDWDPLVLEPSHDAVPCPDDLETTYPCTRQVVPSRAVVLTRDLGPDAVPARWTVIVSPSGTVLSAVGRVAVAA
jgi:hypothetical protein